MRQSLTTASVMRLAAATQHRASRLTTPSRLFGWWHERRFVRSIDEFARALHHLPQTGIESGSGAQLHEVSGMVNAIVNDIEEFIGRHGNDSLKRVEQDRHLVKRIYEMRETFESLVHHTTQRANS